MGLTTRGSQTFVDSEREKSKNIMENKTEKPVESAPGGLKSFLQFAKHNSYELYVLFIMMILYFINQCNTFSLVATNLSMSQEIEYGERVCDVTNETMVNQTIEDKNLNISAVDYCEQNSELCNNEEESGCYWRYTGLGVEYQLLAGPFYIVVFSISGIPMGLLCELNNLNRKIFLGVCAVLWSVMTILGGFCTEYWQIAICRILLGVFSAGCVPFAVSIISDYFSQEKRGAALGFFNWGVYLGFSMTFLLMIAERELGWRSVYFIAGVPGLVLAIVAIVTVKEPIRGGNVGDKEALTKISDVCSKLKTAALNFLQPSLLMLCLGGAIRNGAGIVWAYNLVPFFEEYHPDTNTEEWMSWIPLIFGSIGAFGGGFISDKMAKRFGTRGRLAVLILCLIFSAPFVVGVLYAPMPWAMLCHIPSYVIGEMWIGVCVAVVVDLVPADLTASSVAVYFFIIQIIGGNMNLLETPIRKSLDMRTAVLIMYPGMYIVGALFFVLTAFIAKPTEKKVNYPEYDPSEFTSKDKMITEKSATGSATDNMVHVAKF